MCDYEYYCAFDTKLINKAIRSQLRKLTVMSKATSYGYWKEFENLYKRGKKLKLLILEGVHIKKKRQWKLERSNLEVGDRVVLDNIDWRIIKILDIKKKPKVVTVFSEFSAPFVIPEYMKEIMKVIGKQGKVIFSHSRPGKNFMYGYMRDHLARVARCKERSKLIHLIDEREKLKEFHKRPYVKVVTEEVKGKPEGEENSDKIKYPCWCLYKIYGQSYTGQLNCDYRGDSYVYKLYKVVDQTKGANLIESSTSIQYLLSEYKIEILKGELRLWKVVK